MVVTASAVVVVDIIVPLFAKCEVAAILGEGGGASDALAAAWYQECPKTLSQLDAKAGAAGC